MRRPLIALALLALSALPAQAARRRADVVVYGGTASGVVAAVAASREDKTVLLLEPGKHLGGMVAGGLGATDVGDPGAVGGLSLEFFQRVRRHYAKRDGEKSQAVKDCAGGFRFAPSVASAVFAEMLKEAKVTVLFDQRLDAVEREGSRLVALKTVKGDEFKGLVYVDATYEGDLLAAAGVKYHVGREGREVYGESLAGVMRFSPAHQWPVRISGMDGKNRLPFVQADALGKPGEGDRRVQAYNYRLCLTDRKENQVPFPRPRGYDAGRFELLARYLAVKPGLKMGQLMNPVRVPDGKTDVNNNGPFSTDHIGANWDYPEADPKRRLALVQDHVGYTQGFLYFLANDKRVPPALRQEVNGWGLARDEFTDNDNWPPQLYVREARRMVGSYVMTQADILDKDKSKKEDSVGLGSYNTDSHHVQRILNTDGTALNEGDFQVPVTPYAIPYRSLTPKGKECENLLVSVCVSASHVAYGSVRMEPVYMILGHACGVAASLAVEEEVSVQRIDVGKLQGRLAKQKAVLSPEDVPARKGPRVLDVAKLAGVVVDDEDAKLTGEWKRSAANGPHVGKGYLHDGDANKGTCKARFEPRLPKAGRYEVRVYYPPSSNRASDTLVVVKRKAAESSFRIDQRMVYNGDVGMLIGAFEFAGGGGEWVEIRNDSKAGYVVADAVAFVPVR